MSVNHNVTEFYTLCQPKSYVSHTLLCFWGENPCKSCLYVDLLAEKLPPCTIFTKYTNSKVLHNFPTQCPRAFETDCLRLRLGGGGGEWERWGSGGRSIGMKGKSHNVHSPNTHLALMKLNRNTCDSSLYYSPGKC